MAYEPNRYYRPYMSDSDESDTDDTASTTGSTASSGSSQPSIQGPNYRQFATQLQLTKAAGPNFPVTQEQLVHHRSERVAPYMSDMSGADPDSLLNKYTTKKTQNTSVIMLDSRDRDKNVYPQPTSLTLRLPRIYKNIKNFQILQINLLSAFYYFRASKNNLTITIQETGRSLPITTTIREGTYNIDTLVAELNLQLNYTPIFYYFQNGIADFAPLFTTSGDYSVNFNKPGDNFYDSVNDAYILNPTTSQIVQKYFQNVNAGLTNYTISQVKVAYYYPVLKEFLLDTYTYKVKPTLVIPPNLNLQNGESSFTRCVYTFQGLDDSVIQQVIDVNIDLLDTYRNLNTFLTSLVNKYSVSSSTNNNRITISSSSLNTSLITLLNAKYTQFLSEQLLIYKVSFDTYSLLSITNTYILAIITDMYKHMQIQFATYFGINFNTYTPAYYANIQNQLDLQNAFQNFLSNNTTKQFSLTNSVVNSNDILLQSKTQSPTYWTNLSNLPRSYDLVSSNTNPFNTTLDYIDTAHVMTDSNGIFYQNPLAKSTDIVTNINAAKYTVFSFKSLARQTLRVTTLPRPIKYRYTSYNSNYSSNIKSLFDASYCFIQNAQNATMDVIPSSNLAAIPPFTFETSSISTSVTFDPNTTRTFITFKTPTLTTAPCKYTMNLTLQNSSNISTVLFLYHDRGAFMADISDVRNEKPIHYITSNSYSLSTISTSFTVYGNQRYYVLFRTVSLAVDTSLSFSVTPYCTVSTLSNLSTTAITDPTLNPASNLTNANFAYVADPDFIQLPINSNLYASNKLGADTNLFNFTTTQSKIGYDSNGVSTDLTDYAGYTYINNFLPTSTTRVDPISGYIFNVGSGNYFNTTTQTYLTSNTSYGNGNQVKSPDITKPVFVLKALTHEFVIAHWYSEIFIPNTDYQPYVIPDAYALSSNTYGDTIVPTSLPYVQDLVYPSIFTNITTNVPALDGYTFQGKKLALGTGVMGISFIPGEGVWDISKIMLRSAYIKANLDTNLEIKYLGIFPTAYINSRYNTQIHIHDSLMSFSFSSSKTYEPSSSNFDPIGGTYYEWVKINQSTSKYLNGFTQTPGTFIPDSNAYYSIVPFTANLKLTTYSLLSGSLVPYPLYSDASASPVYLDGTKTPTGAYVINPVKKTNADPTLGPPKGFDQSQSKYEQSIPIGSSAIQYLEPPSIITMYPYDLSNNNTHIMNVSGTTPFTNIYLRVANYILYETNGVYNIYTYTNDTPDRLLYEKSYQTTLTTDLFFTNFPNTQLVGISGNSSVFAFLGLLATPSPSGYMYTFIIETFNPAANVIDTITTIVINTDTYITNPSALPGTTTNPLYPLFIGNTIKTVESFNYNDNQGFTFTIQYGDDISTNCIGVAKGSPVYDTTQPFLLINNLASPLTVYGLVYGITVTDVDILGSILTFTTLNAHGLTVGQSITVSGLVPRLYNRTFTIRTVDEPNTFTAVFTLYLPTRPTISPQGVTIVNNTNLPTCPLVGTAYPSDGFVTYFTTLPHGLLNGQSVTVSSLNNTGTSAPVTPPSPTYNGTFTTTSLTTTSFTVINTTIGGTITGTSGQIKGNISAGLVPTYHILQSAFETTGRFYIAAKTPFSTTGKYKAPTNLKYNLREPVLVNDVVRDVNTNYMQNGLYYVNPLVTLDYTNSNVALNLSNINSPYVYTPFLNDTYSNTTTLPSIVRLHLVPETGIQPAAFSDITLIHKDNKLIFTYDMYDMSNNNGVPTITYYEALLYSGYDATPSDPVNATLYASNVTYFPTSSNITDTNENVLCPYQSIGGGSIEAGAFWFVFNETNRTVPTNASYNILYGNRGDNLDYPINVENAYQIFYPTQRIVMTKIENTYNPITDVSSLVAYPEYPHTAVFAYDTLSNFITDISSNKWGFESASNYISADYGLTSGYYFNACDLNIPLLSNATYYIALRGYSPTEKSQVITRFSLPNRYDFGYTKIIDLSNEIILSQTSPTSFNSNYSYVLENFNSNFVFNSVTFGSNIIQGYAGSNYTNITGFGDFLSKFITIYNVYTSNVNILGQINSNVQSNLTNFISHDLSGIIPPTITNRQRYTDPIVYSILWKTALPPQYQKVENNWGLGWNLGFDKADTEPLTSHVAPSFYKILDDYINLRLNPEFDMNQIDTGFKENLQLSKESTGSTKSYFGKLLLNSFGAYSQTMVSNPIVFNIPVPKLDKLSFTWYDNVGAVIDNNNCEWTTVVQVIEEFDLIGPTGS